MKLFHINDVQKFLTTVDKCSGKVELVTIEGDRLNLKSKLTQYVAFAKLFKDKDIPEMEIVCYNAEDVKRFIDFAMLN